MKRYRYETNFDAGVAAGGRDAARGAEPGVGVPAETRDSRRGAAGYCRRFGLLLRVGEHGALQIRQTGAGWWPKTSGRSRGCRWAANHIGDIDVWDGEIYAGIETFDDGRGENIQVAVYDAGNLKWKRSIDWEPESGQVEVCGLAVDRDGDMVWMADWVDGRYVYGYNRKTGQYGPQGPPASRAPVAAGDFHGRRPHADLCGRRGCRPR